MATPETLKGLIELFEYIPGVHFWIKDREGRFLAANLAFVKHFGLKSFREMEGKTDFDLHPHPFALEYTNDDRAILLAKKGIANKMELVSELDGSLKWYSTTKVPLQISAEGGKEVWATAGLTRQIEAFVEDQGDLGGLAKAVDRIQKHYSEELTVADLAEMAGLSVVQFERNFRKFMKETPSKYINKTRMRVACQLLLRSDLSIAEVAEKTGFRDSNYFSKRFFLYLRIPPSDYRRKYGTLKTTPNAGSKIK